MSLDAKDNIDTIEEFKEIDVAKIEGCDIGFDDHGIFMIFARFIYQKGGYATDIDNVSSVDNAENTDKVIVDNNNNTVDR